MVESGVLHWTNIITRSVLLHQEYLCCRHLIQFTVCDINCLAVLAAGLSMQLYLNLQLHRRDGHTDKISLGATHRWSWCWLPYEVMVGDVLSIVIEDILHGFQEVWGIKPRCHLVHVVNNLSMWSTTVAGTEILFTANIDSLTSYFYRGRHHWAEWRQPTMSWGSNLRGKGCATRGSVTSQPCCLFTQDADDQNGSLAVLLGTPCSHQYPCLDPRFSWTREKHMLLRKRWQHLFRNKPQSLGFYPRIFIVPKSGDRWRTV